MSKVVAIVDDEDTLREAIAIFLDLEGYEVRAFDDARNALEQLCANPPDLLITDLRMEGLGGIDLIRALRSEHPSMAAVVMTGYGSYDTAVEALRLGVVDYLEKPVRLDTLKECFARAFEPSAPPAPQDPDALVLPAEPAARERCARFLAGRLTALGLPGQVRRDLCAAVLAGVDNILRHAYPSPGKGTLELRLERRGAGEVLLVLSDRGAGFEPFSEQGVLRAGTEPGGLELALRRVPGLRLDSIPGQGTRIEFPIDREILSTSAAWAAWSFDPRGPDPWGCKRPDLPWHTQEMERLEEGNGSEPEGANECAEEDEQTARSVLWL